MNFLSLHRQLDRILTRSRRALLGQSLWIEVSGGLPHDMQSRRYALIGGQTFEPEEGESRDAFELRLASVAVGRPVVLAGLPPLPGSETMLPEAPEAEDDGDYWGDQTT